jgi:hypothetical protein
MFVVRSKYSLALLFRTATKTTVLIRCVSVCFLKRTQKNNDCLLKSFCWPSACLCLPVCLFLSHFYTHREVKFSTLGTVLCHLPGRHLSGVTFARCIICLRVKFTSGKCYSAEMSPRVNVVRANVVQEIFTPRKCLPCKCHCGQMILRR